MKEYKPEQNKPCIEFGKRELELFLTVPDAQQKRPCPNCKAPCACSGSQSCTCQCSAHCPSLPFQLSSDPDKYPVERKIIPLTYALNCLRKCPTYWSCEGHENSTQQLLKPPRVYFYSESALVPSLLTDYLSLLSFRKILTFSWSVKVIGMTEQFHPQYSIEPNVTPGTVGILQELQADANNIAENLFSGLKKKAKDRLTRLNS